MDVRQLLSLAGDNSALAKKKVKRLSKQDLDDEPAISDNAVASFLAKQKKFKEKLAAEEAAKKQKRIQERLDASMNKPTRKDKKISSIKKAVDGEYLPGDKRNENAQRKLEKELAKKKEEEETRIRREKKRQLRQEKEDKEKAEQDQLKKERQREMDKLKSKWNIGTGKKTKKREKSESPEEPAVEQKVRRSKAWKPFESTLETRKNKERVEKVIKMNDKKREKEQQDAEYAAHLKREKRRKEKEKEREREVQEIEKKRKEKERQRCQKLNKTVSKDTLSFADLMKKAQNNVSNIQIADDGQTLMKKKAKTFDEEHSSTKKTKQREREMSDEPPPAKSKHTNNTSSHKEKHATSSNYKSNHSNDGIDRHHKEKRKELHNNIQTDKHKSKHKPPEKEITASHKSQKKLSNGASTERNDIPSKKLSNGTHSKHDDYEDSDDAPTKSSKKSKESSSRRSESPPVKRGLTSQTISTKKNGSIEPSNKISQTFKQVKPGRSGIEAQQSKGRRGAGGGIESQFKSSKQKVAKRAKPQHDDMEDELDREMKMLAKKRKLFELRRVTGNAEIDEEDFLHSSEDLSEEDESDADFIDDTETPNDVSKYIRKITGYDRRIYDDESDDDNNMESSYSQIQKEETRSSRIAAEEDRIERLQEEEELAREAAKLAALKKKKTVKR